MPTGINDAEPEYLKRINKVLDFIEQNLDADLSLEQLSQKAHYSPYHFHRVFSAVIGQNLNQYINRKRIERIASILLVSPDTPLKELAFKYGFNSDNSFSRAFKKHYGISPTTFKSQGKELLSKIGIEPFTTPKYICDIDNIKKWLNMNAQITIKELPEIQLASIMHIGEFDKMAHMYEKLMKWTHEKGKLPASGFKAITLYHDNPNVTPISKVRFSAGVTVSEKIKAEGEIRPYTIQKGPYAIGQFEIKAEDISKAWKSMTTWVIENEYEFRDGDYFEMYHNDPKTHPEKKCILDICIPLEENSKNQPTPTNFSPVSKQHKKSEAQLSYHELIDYMKELRAFFQKEYDATFKLGSIYKGNPDYSYFSLTTEELKKLKLKFVIILNHKEESFTICLSGQNKNIRKKYWRLFKESDWHKYHIVESIDNSLLIIDHTLVEKADFSDTHMLTQQIETTALEFMDEIRNVLEC